MFNTEQLDRIESKLDLLKLYFKITFRRIEEMAVDLTGLQFQVASVATVEGSAIALIQGIAEKINAAVSASDAATQAQVAELTASLKTSSDALAAAVVAGTPAAPVVVPPVVALVAQTAPTP